ncbi:hypothetical protein TNCV_281481 [Trichonephila clavipes]|nr:hypothetical protein TNCV_281481 [Trichonephila clavipes]
MNDSPLKKNVRYPRAIGNGTSNFEPWSTPELAPPSTNYHINGRVLNHDRFTDLAPLHGGSSVVPGIEPVTLRPQFRDRIP